MAEINLGAIAWLKNERQKGPRQKRPRSNASERRKRTNLKSSLAEMDVLSPTVSDEALEREGLTSVVKTVMNPATRLLLLIQT